MVWTAVYPVVALAVAVAAHLFAERFRAPGDPAPQRPAALAALAGLLWPAVVIGLAQWGLIAAIASAKHPAQPPATGFDGLPLTGVAH
ncbi:MAG: hypothetical protein K0U67_13370 [Actinomycetia bacterium]|nr:hypothetical protein [Actinomycetes bacterium]